MDVFHDENTYIICLDRERLAGMVALRGKRPFSLDRKLEDLDRYLSPGRSLCEFRLLAVEKDYRSGPVFFGLARHSAEHAIRGGYDTAVISGTTLQLDLYRHLGFVPFGPLVGTPSHSRRPRTAPRLSSTVFTGCGRNSASSPARSASRFCSVRERSRMTSCGAARPAG